MHAQRDAGEPEVLEVLEVPNGLKETRAVPSSTLNTSRTSSSTWPIATVVGFLATPGRHIFLEPNVTKIAAREHGFELEYESRPQ